MACSYCSVSGHAIDECPERLEDKFGDTQDFDEDGRRTDRVSLRDGETRDDDNTHARRNAAQLAMAEDMEDDK